ncbi:uncharacterized protein [Atheta coriaria]|uniref:uncharacterized protein n=1 Tax=Dalotia coriaria TaxID=877792 RepID=UPI0031F3D9D4
MTKLHIARTPRQKSFIFLSMIVGLYLIIHFAPSVDKNYLSCDRPCHDYDWPMICRVTLTIDNNSCSKKNSSINDILHSVRNLLPGPTIHVCQNDVVFVTVIKNLPGELKFNWQDSQTANDEGVVIQPANETNIQYKFRATYPGTHLWNAFIDNIRFTGAIVVRKSPLMNIEKNFYDVDDRNHTIMLSECNDKQNMMINGQVDNGKVFLVDYGKNYLFRTGIFRCIVL